MAICRLCDGGNGRAAAALHEAGAEGIVADLPNGLETMLTKVHDDGQHLSRGQDMRIILARALHAGSPTLLVDEPGPGLDVEARRRLLAILKRPAPGRVVVVASHDPDVLAIADDTIDLHKP